MIARSLCVVALLATVGCATLHPPQPWEKGDLAKYEDAAKWYRATYPPAKYPRRTLKNQSGVRAMHITNPNSGEWEGANLYETPRGEVRVFVLGRGDQQPARR